MLTLSLKPSLRLLFPSCAPHSLPPRSPLKGLLGPQLPPPLHLGCFLPPLLSCCSAPLLCPVR